MNTQYFEYIVEIDRTRSITQAAENLYMAQPNLSKAVKELEQQIGFAIFERTSRGVVPTRRGEEFLVYARSIIHQLQKISQLEKQDASIQRFSISIPRGSYIADAVTNQLKELNDTASIQIDVMETNAMQTIRDVESGMYQLGIIRYQTVYENYFMDYLEDKKLQHELIWEFDHVVYLPKDHVLVTKDELLVEDLKPFVEVSHGDTTIPYIFTDRVETADADKNRRIYVHDRFNQFEILSALPYTYMWGSALPTSLEDRYGLVQRACKNNKRNYKDIIIYTKDYKLSEFDQRFIEKLCEARDEVAQKKYK